LANPQCKNGYLKIANEIMDALIRIRIPGEARQILDFIIRKTYGFNKKRDAIPLSQFVEATGIRRPNIVRSIIKLETMRIIKKETGATTNYMFNKNFDEWKPLSKKIRGVSKKITGCLKIDNKPVSKKRHSKDITKDNIQKTSNMSPIQFVNLYHESLPFGRKVLKLTKKRKQHINARLKEYPDKQFWIHLFKRVVKSKFLRGEIPPREGYKQFQINIEFVINENKIAKILEGEYDDRSTTTGKLSWLERKRLEGYQGSQGKLQGKINSQESGAETGSGNSDI